MMCKTSKAYFIAILQKFSEYDTENTSINFRSPLRKLVTDYLNKNRQPLSADKISKFLGVSTMKVTKLSINF